MTISRAGRWPSASSRSASSPARSPSMIRRLSRSHSGRPGQFRRPAGLDRGRVHALEQLQQPGQRVVALPPPVVDQVERGLELLPADPGDRHDPRRVDDRRVEPGAHALVEEDRVQHRPRRRVQAERDVRDAQRGLHVRVAALDRADRLDRLQRVPPGLLLAGGDRERQAVHDDVGRAHAPVAGEVLDQPGGDRRSSTRRCAPGPRSSMVSAITAAPCSLTSGITRAIRDPGPSPSS